MKTPERFDRAIKALVQAFFDETLAKGHCGACAVGNMVAASHKIKVTKQMIESDRDNYHESWSYLGYTATNEDRTEPEQFLECTPTFISNRKSTEDEIALAKALIIPTGYEANEILAVEYAFEINTKIAYFNYEKHTKEEIMQDQFNGLMAVVDVLCKLDNIEPAEYKKVFEYTADFKPVTVLS